MFFLLILLLVFLVRSNIQGAGKEKNYLPVFFRILTNHFQLLTITASFDLSWPPVLQQFFTSAKPVSDASSQFFSVDCFLDKRNTANEENGDSLTRVFFQKLIVEALAPIVIVLTCIAVWQAIFKVTHLLNDRPLPIEEGSIRNNASREEMLESDLKQGRIITTIIVILFLFHPTITTTMFNAFK